MIIAERGIAILLYYFSIYSRLVVNHPHSEFIVVHSYSFHDSAFKITCGDFNIFFTYHSEIQFFFGEQPVIEVIIRHTIGGQIGIVGQVFFIVSVKNKIDTNPVLIFIG
jgi:hypothetical protein